MGVNLAITHFVTQVIQFSRHFRALDRKLKKTFFRENGFANVVSEIHKNYLFCLYNPPKIRNNFMFVSFYLF